MSEIKPCFLCGGEYLEYDEHYFICPNLECELFDKEFTEEQINAPRAADAEIALLKELVEEAERLLKNTELGDFICYQREGDNEIIHSPKCRFRAWERRVNKEGAS